MAKAKPRQLEIHPLTPERWADFEKLFGPRGACAGCWCLFWRQTRREYDAGRGESNRVAMKELVDGESVPGLIGYVADEPVAWVAVAPREEYVRLGTSRILKPIDEKPVWSVTCFFVRKDQRRRGHTVQLLRAACEFVRAAGGKVVEGYPVEPKSGESADTFAFTGLAKAFRAAGFQECARRSETRPIMRFEIGRRRVGGQ